MSNPPIKALNATQIQQDVKKVNQIKKEATYHFVIESVTLGILAVVVTAGAGYALATCGGPAHLGTFVEGLVLAVLAPTVSGYGIYRGEKFKRLIDEKNAVLETVPSDRELIDFLKAQEPETVVRVLVQVDKEEVTGPVMEGLVRKFRALENKEQDRLFALFKAGSALQNRFLNALAVSVSVTDWRNEVFQGAPSEVMKRAFATTLKPNDYVRLISTTGHKKIALDVLGYMGRSATVLLSKMDMNDYRTLLKILQNESMSGVQTESRKALIRRFKNDDRYQEAKRKIGVNFYWTAIEAV